MKNPAQHDYTTLMDATEDMKKRGYTHDFNIHEHHIECKELGENYKPEQFVIKEFHRFEGMSNPDDSSIIYAVETTSGTKGTLIDAYGMYDSLSQDMIKRLDIRPNVG